MMWTRKKERQPTIPTNASWCGKERIQKKKDPKYRPPHQNTSDPGAQQNTPNIRVASWCEDERQPPINRVKYLHHIVRKKELQPPIITELHLDQENLNKSTQSNTPRIGHLIKAHLAQGHSRTLPTSELHHDVRNKDNHPSTQHQMQERTKSISATNTTRYSYDPYLLHLMKPDSANECAASCHTK